MIARDRLGRVMPPPPDRATPRPLERWQWRPNAMVQNSEIDPSFVITHRAGLEEGPDLYKTFRDKEDGCINVVLRPNG